MPLPKVSFQQSAAVSRIYFSEEKDSRTTVTLYNIWARAQKIHNKTRATSKYSDQPAHLHSLIRVFPDHMCLQLPLGYPNREEQEPFPYWVNVQADLCGSHRSYCRFCRVLAHFISASHHISKPAKSQPQNITKTRLFKYIETFTSKKLKIFR